MLDFMTIATKTNKKTETTDVYPKFIMRKSKDLMVRGRDFYAIWDDEQKMWSTDEDDATRLIDNELRNYVEAHEDKFNGTAIVHYMWDADSGSIDKFHKYCQKQMRDSYHELDGELIFANTELSRESYASKKLPYPLVEGSIDAYDELVGTLYSAEERHKFEWAIGTIVSGESTKIQKFLVFYGSQGTGKSTVMNIIQKLFEGYYCSFEAKALGQANNAFALEPFKDNPLVAIQHDGDLSRIEDNTRLNSLVSHEAMTVNEKFKGIYETRFKCFLFMGTNRPVKITDGKSGLLRRLIDVTPSGKKLAKSKYLQLYKQVDFELGAIAYHCLEVYKENPDYYDDYIPKNMMSASNDFYNFVCDSFSVFRKNDGTTLNAAWEMYKQYVEDAKVYTQVSKRIFKEELKNYFWNFEDRVDKEDGSKLYSYYSGFRIDIFEEEMGIRSEHITKEPEINLIEFKEQESIFDKEYANCVAQYATTEASEKPMQKWENVTTKLSDLDTSKVHYVRVPENHIVIDFDIKDENGNKCFEKNLEAASKWPATYAELSKSGGGIHLHYIYTGEDPSQLSRIYDKDIEVKVFTGNSSLRRRLSKCNNIPIATISSGLALKGVKKMINFDGVKNEKMLRSILKRHINKEIMVNTKPSIDMIYKVLEEAYESGIGYDVSDLKNAVYVLAASSTNQADTCLKMVAKMHFKSEETNNVVADSEHDEMVFYDVEVFPNLFLVCYKMAGLGKPVVRMINPTPDQIESLVRFKLVGFNNRAYDNHMIYACMMGYTNEQLYNLSKRLINKDKSISRKAKFSEAFNLSFTDIYDFASAGNKKSLKKLEIEMGKQIEEKLRKRGYSEEAIKFIKSGNHHQELGLPWDEPVNPALWTKVADYCINDVMATEAAFHYLKGDWIAREILADITGMSVNDTTNSLSQRIIFGNDRNPQSKFNYRFLGDPVGSDKYEEYREKFGADYKFRVFNEKGLPEYRDYVPGEVLPDGWSILPFFPGYDFDQYRAVKSMYMGEEIGEGGRVYAEPGIYGKVWDGDVTGQHPSSILAEVLFGPEYTKAFADIVFGRVSIKHQAWNDIDGLFDGKLKPYIQQVIDGKLTSKELANALKTVVNAVYGQTKATYPCAFRDDRNIDNIVAKRGALFMTLLKSEVQKRGFTVCHIKTDSIKIPDATPEIQQFVLDFGKEYGYSFETEAEFEKYCLVNKAVYIAKTKDGEWTATGDQFAVPYVFKKLFSKEEIVFEDLCETFEVKNGALYLDVNEQLPDVTEYEKELSKAEDKYKKGKISDTMMESISSELNDKIAAGHEYKFVGRVGHFCPIKPGKGGGVLYRIDGDKRAAASGTTGYRWLESEMIKGSNEDVIDLSYFTKLVDDAVDTINKYGDAEWFMSDDPYVPDPKKQSTENFMNIPIDADEELPFDLEDKKGVA